MCADLALPNGSMLEKDHNASTGLSSSLIGCFRVADLGRLGREVTGATRTVERSHVSPLCTANDCQWTRKLPYIRAG